MNANEKRRDDGSSRGGWAAGMGTLAEYSVVGFVFPLALAIGFFVGRWIGGLLGGPTVGALAGVLLGTAAGFYNLWQTMQRLERREAARRSEGTERPDDEGTGDRGERG